MCILPVFLKLSRDKLSPETKVLSFKMRVSVLSIRAGSQLFWPVFDWLLSSCFTVNSGKKLKIRKRSNKKNCETSRQTSEWKLIEGLWNACDIFTEQDSARNQLKIMKRSRKNNCFYNIGLKCLSLSKGSIQEF